MNVKSSTVAMPASPDRFVQDRDAEITGAIRCRAYGAYSALLASPHEIDLEEQIGDADEALDTQPYGIDLNAITAAYLKCPQAQRALEYSGLFEVGDRGPAVPIREQQQFNNRAGVREDLVRFYEFFDYGLDQGHAWAPDHLSVMLEFYHLLCFHECRPGDDRLSYQLAQADFASRHLLHWVPVFAERINTVSPNSIYAEVALSLCDFVAKDYEWQVSTVVTADKDCDRD